MAAQCTILWLESRGLSKLTNRTSNYQQEIKIDDFTCDRCHISWGKQHTPHRPSAFAAGERMMEETLDIYPASKQNMYNKSLGWLLNSFTETNLKYFTPYMSDAWINTRNRIQMYLHVRFNWCDTSIHVGKLYSKSMKSFLSFYFPCLHL